MGKLESYEALNPKHQIPNIIQTLISNDLNGSILDFGHWNSFGILNSILSSSGNHVFFNH
jgi:hypothetical protein